ncbi:MAG TPA: SNF2-related protein [Candidatus Binatia bacterium]|jgi:superfamily II DNA or RNA helicase
MSKQIDKSAKRKIKIIFVNPFEKDPDETYRAYQRFRKRNENDKAYRCIESLLKRFPDDMGLLDEVVDLALGHMRAPNLARPWLVHRIKLASYWRDFALLSEIDAVSGNLTKAKENLALATKLQKRQRFLADTRREVKEALDRARNIIRLQEHNRWVERIATQSNVQPPGKQRDIPVPAAAAKLPAVTAERKQPRPLKSEAHAVTAPPVIPALASYRAPLRFAPPDFEVMNAMLQTRGTLKECQLRVEYAHVEVQRGFDDLLCLNAIEGVERYWYQLETAKKVLKYFHGRVLLCDEVGLGKTIEAGMLMKEYLLRGMVKNILILTPAPLVSQWQEEMVQKFDILFATTDDPLFSADPDRFWRGPFIIASIHTAKSIKNFARVAGNFYDLVVVDEAHHLKNRNTLNWKLVNEIKKRFIFLLSATPVQNHLIELFNLITLLKPGQFKTERLFKQAYMQRGDSRKPANKERLRELLRDVMIRNTRSAIDLKLPRRFATTVRLEPSAAERELYNGITDFARARSDSLPGPLLQLLLREAGSSPAALRATLMRLRSEHGESVDNLLNLAQCVRETARETALLEILGKNREEKKVVFTQYLKTLDSVASLLERQGLHFALFSGNLSAGEKEEAIRRFREDLPILLSTESGGEGRNLQFCNTLVNFDLPWNPMRIEQRIGRLHRIGQNRDVFIFNLSVRETLEDHILQILENKINMFEMVIGEIEPLLGYLGEEREFEDVVMEIWMRSRNHEEACSRFEVFGQDLVQAKANYLESKELDREIFGEDYEV